MKTIATVLLALAGTTNLLAETVYLSQNGKTYHKTETCMALARSKVKLHAERTAAEQHGLKACSICYRPKSAKKQPNNGWAKP